MSDSQQIGQIGPETTPETTNKRKGVSMRACIDKCCKQCIYDGFSGSGTWRQQVEACTSYDCGLYPVRPIPTNKRRSDMDIQ